MRVADGLATMLLGNCPYEVVTLPHIRIDLHTSHNAGRLDVLDHTKEKGMSFEWPSKPGRKLGSNRRVLTYPDSSTLALRAAMVGFLVVAAEGHDKAKVPSLELHQKLNVPTRQLDRCQRIFEPVGGTLAWTEDLKWMKVG